MTPAVREALEEALRGGTAPVQRAQAPVCLFVFWGLCVCEPRLGSSFLGSRHLIQGLGDASCLEASGIYDGFG